MSQEDLKADVSKAALKLCKARISNKSVVALPEILSSIHKQLEWLVSYFEGKNNDRDKFETLVFGHYAAREVDHKDEEFVNALYNAAYVADQTAKGLKVDVSKLQNDS